MGAYNAEKWRIGMNITKRPDLQFQKQFMESTSCFTFLSHINIPDGIDDLKALPKQNYQIWGTDLRTSSPVMLKHEQRYWTTS